MSEAYGVWAEKSMYGKRYWGALRATFIIGEDGTVERVFPKVSPKTHNEAVRPLWPPSGLGSTQPAR